MKSVLIVIGLFVIVASVLLTMTTFTVAQNVGPPFKDIAVDNRNSRSVDDPCIQLKKLEGFCVGVAPENQSPEKAIVFCLDKPEPPWPSREQQKICKDQSGK